MKTLQTMTPVTPSRPTLFARVACVLVVPIALAFASCACPEPKTPAALPDSPPHLAAAKAALAAAEQKKLWTAQDEREFSRNIAHLSEDTRLALATQLARDVNSKAIRIERRPPSTKGPQICPCVPGMCAGVTTTPAAADPAVPVTGTTDRMAAPANMKKN
jgi:hypothetical protein